MNDEQHLAAPCHRPVQKRTFVVLGNSRDINDRSGLPYFFVRAGIASGFLDGAIDLPMNRFTALRWRASQWLRRSGTGGFQFTDTHLRRQFALAGDAIRGREIVSDFQGFPSAEMAKQFGITASFYIDSPLTRLFTEYGPWIADIGSRLDPSVARAAVARETAAYHHAKLVICRSRLARDILIDEYGIDADKVHYIAPGANLTEAEVERHTAGLEERPIPSVFGKDRPLRLGFIGKDPLRKGLPRLVEAANILTATGIASKVVVIGRVPPELKNAPGIRDLGFIDKTINEDAFIRAVMDFDIGCLPSHAEALGLGSLECLRLGVPVLGTDTGGIRDAIPDDAGILVEAGASGEQIAGHIRMVVSEPGRLAQLHRAARQRRRHYAWDRTLREFAELWQRYP